MSKDAHAGSGGEAEAPLYDTNVATPTHGERARTLVAGIRTGTLCTLAKDPEGYPYGSFVTFAMDGAAPVFFISDLARRTSRPTPVPPTIWTTPTSASGASTWKESATSVDTAVCHGSSRRSSRPELPIRSLRTHAPSSIT